MEMIECYTYDIPISDRKVIVILTAGFVGNDAYCDTFVFMERENKMEAYCNPKLFDIAGLKGYVDFFKHKLELQSDYPQNNTPVHTESDEAKQLLSYLLEEYGIRAAEAEILGRMLEEEDELLRLKYSGGRSIFKKEEHVVAGINYLKRKKMEALSFLENTTKSESLIEYIGIAKRFVVSNVELS